MERGGLSIGEVSPILLLVHPGAIGDVLLALEAVRALRSAFPLHEVVWVGQSEIGNLLLDSKEVNGIIGSEGRFFSKLLMKAEEFDDHSQAILQRCTHCVCWMTDHEKILAGNLESFGIRFIIHSPRSAELADYHHEDRFLRTLEPWGITPDSGREKSPHLRVKCSQIKTDYLGRQFRFLENPYVVFHPGSGSLHKCVAPSLLREIAEGLPIQGSKSLVILSGPADVCQVEALLPYLQGMNYCLVNNHSLSEVARVLEKAALYIGHDSGISHLAVWVGTPSILLFGPTHSTHWAPRGDRVTVVQGPVCQCSDWGQVRQCPEKPCLNISADLVLQEAEQKLSLEGKSPISDIKSQKEATHEESRL